jgi:hypothetical protein
MGRGSKCPGLFQIEDMQPHHIPASHHCHGTHMVRLRVFFTTALPAVGMPRTHEALTSQSTSSATSLSRICIFYRGSFPGKHEPSCSRFLTPNTLVRSLRIDYTVPNRSCSAAALVWRTAWTEGTVPDSVLGIAGRKQEQKGRTWDQRGID